MSNSNGLNLSPPLRIENQLARRWRGMNRAAMRVVRERLLPALERGVAGPELAEIILAVQLAAEQALPEDQIRRQARRHAEMADDRHRRLFFTTLGARLGVRFLNSDNPGRGFTFPGAPPPPAALPRLGVKLNFQPTILVDQFVDENIRLIRTMKDGIRGAVGDAVAREVLLGDGNREDLARRLVDLWERKGVPTVVGERNVSLLAHADLVARDQIQKLHGQLERTRQTAAGIRSFVWVTQGDNRVRAKHRALAGRTFSWEEGTPDGELPGQSIACRCHARAVVRKAEVIPNFIDVDGIGAGQTFTARP